MGSLIFVGMKTTIELPDDLMQRIKIRAAEEGRSMKDLLTEALNDLFRHSKKVKKVRILSPSEMPIIKGGHKARPGEEVTPERIAEVLYGSGE